MFNLNIGRDLYLKGRIGWRGLSKDEYLEKSDYRIINATALMDGYVDWNNCGFISKERYEESEEIMLQEGDILISKDGTLGKIGYVKDLKFPCTVASGIFVLRNTIPDRLDFDYLYHVLKSFIFKDFISRNKATGSTINHLYQADLEKFELDIPDLPEQKRISGILNDIDGKISNNASVCDELMEYVQFLYTYWFVQYDFPNKEGRPYKSSGGKLKWSETLKRNIPEPWGETTLRRYVGRITNGLNPRKNFVLGNGENYYITIRSLIGTDIDWDECDKCDDEALAKINSRSQLEKGDVIFSAIGTIGRTYYIQETPSNWNISETSFTLRAADDIASDFFYSLLTSYEIQLQADRKAMGSTMRCLVTDSLCDIPYIDIPVDVINEYAYRVHDIFTKIYELHSENRELLSLRKFVLPMLLNGQIKVA